MSLGIDIKYAIRLLMKKPIFTVNSILIVAVGLSLTLYCYSLLTNLVFKPLYLNGEQQIISIEAAFNENHGYRTGIDPLDLYQLRNESQYIDSLGIYQEGTTLIGDIEQSSSTKKYNATLTEWNIFEFAGVQPILGRGFRPEDHFEGAEPVVVLSQTVWQDYFSANEAIVGSMIRVDSLPTRVVGVMPAGFAFPSSSQVWLPQPQMNIQPTDRVRTQMFAYARLKPNTSLKQFNSELITLNQRIVANLPQNMAWRATSDGRYMRALPFKQANTDVTQYYNVFMSMLMVVLLILILACINIGNLLLSRVNERFKEIAIRVALGVPRKRLVLQMLWESVFICTLGSLLAVVFTHWGLNISNDYLSTMFAVNNAKPFWWHLTLGSDGLWVLILTVVVMILVTGLIPAWRALSDDFNAVLRDGTRGALGRSAARASNALVVSEILLSCVVLVIATILLFSSYSAGMADYGVETQGRLTARLELPLESYPERSETVVEDRKKRTDFYYQLKDQLEVQPHIEAVSFMSSLPGTGEGSSYFEIQGHAADVYNENPKANTESVTRDAWRAVGMTLIEGRNFDHRDTETDMGNVIINASIAKDYFADGNAIGSQIRRVWSTGHREWQTIIGVVSDTFHGSTMQTSSARYTMYRPIDRDGRTQMNIAVHYLGTERQARKTLLDTINAVDINVGAYHIQSYQNLIQQPMLLVSAVSKIFLFCGIVALALAASGIYAVAANSVTQRTQEIGVRKALGATDSKVINLFMGKALIQLLVGLSMGVGLSLWIVNLMTDAMILDNVSVIIGLIGVPLLIASMVLLATFIPTQKAVRLEPSVALHQD
ncbi:ABC transporter permease [Shewanella waksmanii]|uniref:ABC transporter permease n=1 Tax=Shewanella waksmanii TaxID=213783 RepID=UPI000491F05C|nr:ABC transporter permease [Shewanella waksmanii]